MERIADFDTPLQLLNWFMSSNQNSGFYFRGINQEEQIYPTIMRHHSGDLILLEDRILHEFSKYGCSLVGNLTNAFDLVSYAQHFGLPTRLVDWTRNPLVALFFAIYNADKPSSVCPRVLCLPRKHTMPISEPTHIVSDDELYVSYRNPIRDYQMFIKQVGSGKFPQICISTARVLDDMMDLDRTYSSMVYDRDDNCNMIIIDTGYSNQRLLAQDGLFYLPRNLNKPQINLEYDSSCVGFIPINPDWRNEILESLDRIGISQYRLFFDLETITKYIVDKAVTEIEQFEAGFAWADKQDD